MDFNFFLNYNIYRTLTKLLTKLLVNKISGIINIKRPINKGSQIIKKFMHLMLHINIWVEYC